MLKPPDGTSETQRFVVEVTGFQLQPAAVAKIQAALEEAIAMAVAELALEVELSPINAETHVEVAPLIGGDRRYIAGMMVRPKGSSRA